MCKTICVIFRDRIAFYLSDVNIYRDSKNRLRLS